MPTGRRQRKTAVPAILSALLLCAGIRAQERIPIILDTDIGAWSDDALALAYAAKHPKIEILAVTTVMDGSYRAPVALKLLELLGREEVPVFLGARNRLLKGSQAMAGAEKTAQMAAVARLPAPRRAVEPEFAPDWIVRQAMARPGKVTLVSIGPLTNIALGLLAEPRLKEAVKEVVLMGGALDRPEAEWNFKRDPEAARIVLESGLPITMVGLDVTLRCRLTPRQIEDIARAGTPLLKLLGEFLRREDPNDPLFALHDPLALGVTADRSLVKLQRTIIDVETRGEFTAGATVPRRGPTPPEKLARRGIQVALEVDSERFVREFMATLLRR